MKPTVVAKVVNPLGTVVTVQSDDETEQVSEDAVMHENCDEALFRPVVASKNIHYAELRTKTPSQHCDETVTKSLEASTEVAVKILNKKERNLVKKQDERVVNKKKARESPPKQIKESKSKEKAGRVERNERILNRKCNQEGNNVLCDISDPFDDQLDSKGVKCEERIEEEEAIVLGSVIKTSKDDFNFYLPPLENDDFFSLENVGKGEQFEDAEDCHYENFNKENKEKNVEQEQSIFFADEGGFEEKSLTKKVRKPKTKLGVKIGSVNKENVENSLNAVEMPARKSWSSIAASRPTEKSLIDPTEKEKEDSLEQLEVESFPIDVGKESFGSCTIMNDLIDINTPQEERIDAVVNVASEEGDFGGEEMSLLKISDDEKVDTGSSPTETTESDDSSKLPKDLAISNGDEDNPSIIIINQPTSKSAKRKLKKKRK